MWYAFFVSVKLELLQLRHGNLQRFRDASKAGGQGSLVGRRQLLQEIPAIGVTRSSHGAIRLSDEMGDEMEVPHLGEELLQLTKRSVRVELLEMRLRQPLLILAVIVVRPFKDKLPVLRDHFSTDDGSFAIVLIEFQPVGPGPIRTNIDLDLDGNVRMAPGV